MNRILQYFSWGQNHWMHHCSVTFYRIVTFWGGSSSVPKWQMSLMTLIRLSISTLDSPSPHPWFNTPVWCSCRNDLLTVYWVNLLVNISASVTASVFLESLPTRSRNMEAETRKKCTAVRRWALAWGQAVHFFPPVLVSAFAGHWISFIPDFILSEMFLSWDVPASIPRPLNKTQHQTHFNQRNDWEVLKWFSFIKQHLIVVWQIPS